MTRNQRSVTEHQALVRAIVRPRPPVAVPLPTAEGRVLAEDVIAVFPVPPFDNSAVDGYAVATADLGARRRCPLSCSPSAPTFPQATARIWRSAGARCTGS